MGVIMFACPITGKEMPTGIECDEDSFRLISGNALSIQCSVCGQGHSWESLTRWLGEISVKPPREFES
jgi:hypothetical protein